MLELNNIVSGYGSALVLDNLNIKLKKGSITSIIGANGVGKTTTLRTIMGIIQPQKGSVLYNNKNISNLPTYKTANLGIAYCPEGRKIFGNLTVYENLRLGAYQLKSNKELKKNLEEIYSLFPILKERENQISENLSGGEQQMLAVGRALISNPEVILFDEPSLGLAPNLITFIGEIIQKINKKGLSILLIEQNCTMALRISDYVYVMEKGTITLQGTAKEMINNEKVKKVYLGITKGEVK